MTSRPALRPAGFAWLLAHELRLLWRNSILLRTSRHVLIPVILVALMFQGAAIFIAGLLRGQSFTLPVLILIANLNLIFLGGLMLSRAMTLTVDVLFSRGDADFLLAAPLPPVRILAVRMLGVAGSVAAPWALLAGVLANALAWFGHPAALTAYLSVPLIALLATALAFLNVTILTAKLSPATARKLAQTLSLIIGLVIFAGGQAPRFIAAGTLRALYRHAMPGNADLTNPVWLPARAILGEPLPLAALAVITGILFLLILRSRARSYASGAISAAAHRAGMVSRRTHRGFNGGPFTAIMVKNLRLVLRFPGLVTQTVYRSLTLVPAAIILSGHVAIGTGPEIVIPLLVFLTGQLALFFISIIVGADQARELSASAPVQPALGERAGYMAAAIPTIIIMAVPILGVLWRQSGAAPVLLAGMAGAALSNLWLGGKYPIPLFRPEFGKSGTGTVFGLILGVAVSTVWSFLAWVLVTPYPH